MIALTTKCTELDHSLSNDGELVDGVDLPCEVIQPCSPRSRHIPDAEETEIVMVRRGFCPHEHRTTAHRFLHHREAKHFAIKLGTASRIAHVEHRVIQTPNAWHGRKATGLVMCQSLVSASQ